jgi:chorismate mutase
MDAQSGSMSSWDYLDFELEIREGESRGYAVAVRSPAGEAQEEMRFPFDERQLRDKLKDLEIALLRSGGTRRALSTEERTVQEFGRSLFEAVLVGKVGTCYYRSMDQAQQQGKGLRLKLHVQPPNLTVLPWEFLYDPDRDEYLCFSRDTPIVRYTDLRQPIGRLTVAPPLRILGMVASPRDLDPLDVEHEKGLMDEAIEDLQADGLVKVTWLEGETWRDLQRAMRRDGPWHIFHFVGHGDFDPSAEEGLIAFTEKGTGRRHLLRSRDLARLLDGHPYLRLVFLNSCEGARGSEGDPFSGTAATLVRRGIPAVVAMQYQITDKSAIEFCSAFYESLADGLPVDAAVTEARVAVSMDSMLEWGTPVLYMRSRDGRLFDISTDRRPSEQPLDVTDQEVLHEHQEQMAKEKERRERLDTLYTQARRSHQDQEWQAVVDVFEQISAEDQDYADPEGLLKSALEALKRARKEQDALRRYREAVKSTSREGLNERRAQSLRDLANKLELSADAASRIEQEVMDDTKEAILERLEGLYDEARQLHQNREWQAVIDNFARIYLEDANYPDPEGLLASAHEALESVRKEEESLRQYREVVESAWTGGDLDRRQVKRLRDLANELGLNWSAAADIEREVMGETIEAILERQERSAKEDERNRQLEELYTQARGLHRHRKWQAVVDIFEQIRAEDSDYPDPEGLLASARDALEAQEHTQRVAALYDRCERHINAEDWQQALKCLEAVQRLEPGYRDTEELLSRVRRELAPSPTVKVPDLSGQEISQASGMLASKSLKLNSQREVSSDTVPEGRIVEQSPEAGKEVQTDTLVNVTISSGSSTVEIPDLVGKSRDEAKSMLQAAGLRLGTVVTTPGDEAAEDKILEQDPAAGSKVEGGTSVRVTLAQRQIKKLTEEEAPKRAFYPRPDSLPDEPEAESQMKSAAQRSEKPPSEREGKQEKPQDLPD